MAKAKLKTVYVCDNCGEDFPKWQGQCSNCGEWNTLVETKVSTREGTKHKAQSTKGSGGEIYKLSEVEAAGKEERLEVGSRELAQVLGGPSTPSTSSVESGSGLQGLVKGSVALLAGEPGIGKSTLLSQLTLYFASKHGKVLYVCGEESAGQVKLRLDRLSKHKKTTKKAKDNVLLMPEVSTEEVVAAMEREKPVLVIVDSIQTLTCEDLTGMAGSVGQVRESGNRIMRSAKSLGLSVFLVGHVTKQGSIAGPKVLEHMVDTVLSLEGERSGTLRVLRSMKNRFGAVDEVAVYQMESAGLTEVSDPSSLFLGEFERAPGRCVTVVMEGTRPLLVEIQALVVKSNAPNPRVVAHGFKQSRLQVLLAVLQRHVGLKLYDKDVFVNVTSGLKVDEPAADLAVCLAIASSLKDKSLPEKSVAFGEVGLLGEVRGVVGEEKREKEARKLGYGRLRSGRSVSEAVKGLR